MERHSSNPAAEGLSPCSGSSSLWWSSYYLIDHHYGDHHIIFLIIVVIIVLSYWSSLWWSSYYLLDHYGDHCISSIIVNDILIVFLIIILICLECSPSSFFETTSVVTALWQCCTFKCWYRIWVVITINCHNHEYCHHNHCHHCHHVSTIITILIMIITGVHSGPLP